MVISHAVNQGRKPSRSWQNMGRKTLSSSIEFLKPVGTNKSGREDLLTLSVEIQQTIIQPLPSPIKRLADLSREVVDYLLEAVFDKCFTCLSKLTVENLLSCLKNIWNFQDVKPFRHQHPGEITQNGVSFRLRGQSDNVFITPNEIQTKLAVMLS